MVPTSDHELASILETEVGDALRSVSEYDEEGREVHYVREDVDAAYTPADADEIFDDLRLQGLSWEFFEGLFDAGDLNCIMVGLDEALMFHFPGSGIEGLFVTIDTGAEIELDSFVRTCREYV